MISSFISFSIDTYGCTYLWGDVFHAWIYDMMINSEQMSLIRFFYTEITIDLNVVMRNDRYLVYPLPSSPVTKYNEIILQSHHQDINTICILTSGVTSTCSLKLSILYQPHPLLILSIHQYIIYFYNYIISYKQVPENITSGACFSLLIFLNRLEMIQAAIFINHLFL